MKISERKIRRLFATILALLSVALLSIQAVILSSGHQLYEKQVTGLGIANRVLAFLIPAFFYLSSILLLSHNPSRGWRQRVSFLFFYSLFFEIFLAFFLFADSILIPGIVFWLLDAVLLLVVTYRRISDLWIDLGFLAVGVLAIVFTDFFRSVGAATLLLSALIALSGAATFLAYRNSFKEKSEGLEDVALAGLTLLVSALFFLMKILFRSNVGLSNTFTFLFLPVMFFSLFFSNLAYEKLIRTLPGA